MTPHDPQASGIALMAARRPRALEAYLDLTPLLSQSLCPKVHELIRIAIQTSTGAARSLRSTVPRAQCAGASPDEIMDAVLLALPEAGITKVSDALTVVAEFVNARDDSVEAAPEPA